MVWQRAPVRPVPDEKTNLTKRAWRFGLMIPLILIVVGLILRISHKPEAALVNACLITISSLLLIARFLIYCWTAAFLSCAAHLFNLLAALLAAPAGTWAGTSSFLLLAVLLAIVNWVLLVVLDGCRAWLCRSLPFLGKVLKAESVQAEAWSLKSN